MTSRQISILAGIAIGIAAVVIALLKCRRKKAEDPVQPVEGRISQGFSSSHRGVDIAVPSGTEIRAPWSGTVSHVWYDNIYGGGRSMLVRHDNGLTTGYAHLEGYHVGSDDRVLQGQPIALSGNTGSHTTGPHLHFTLRDISGEKIDPTKYFTFKA